MPIGASVGRGGVNDEADVIVVQHLLNAWLRATGRPLLTVDGDCGGKSVTAIEQYQRAVLGSTAPDGRVDPGGRTWRALSATAPTPAPVPSPTPTPAVPKQPSGAAWWHANQARFPNSAVLASLAPPFRIKATAFVEAMRAGGASVTLSSTLRNPTRAHLMHYCWKVAKGMVAPDKVPAAADCLIEWDHGSLASSKKGAQEMVDLFSIAFQPSLTSLHTLGRAVDMTISWAGTIKVEDARGNKQSLSAPRSGQTNTRLHEIGASYGVIKLLSDPPHWSDNGR